MNYEQGEPGEDMELGDLAGNPDAVDEEELEAALLAEIQSAADFAESELAPSRVEATRLYRGEPFGDEEEGRSQVVMPVTRDIVRATLPGLMRIFFGGRRVMAFEPSAQMTTQAASDATEAIDYIIRRKNPGFRILHDAFKDALVRRSGWVKYWLDESMEVSARRYTGLTVEEVQAKEESLEKGQTLEVVEQVVEAPEPSDQGQPNDEPPALYTISITSRRPKREIRLEAVPPDEVRYNREARSAGTARFIEHVRLLPRSDLVAMGYPRDVVDDLPANTSNFSTRQEVLARYNGRLNGMTGSPAMTTPDQELIEYHECYWRVDADGDGISELRKVCCVYAKEGLEVLHQEIVDDVPLCYLTPDIEPHVLEGLSQVDSTKDLQNIESHVFRDVLDSLKASIFPRFGVVENQANIDDVLNTEIGGAIRMRSPGAVVPFDIPFSGEKAFPLFDKLDAIKESRTGIGRGTMGLDGKALQSTTPDAARQSMSAAQSQVELIARIFAETGISDLYRGIYRLLCRHQTSAVWIKRLNGHPLAVDPSSWDPEAEVTVDSALGSGMNDSKIAALQATAVAQKEALTLLGIDNPLCSLQEYYHVQADLLELAGFRDTARYWRSPEVSAQQGIEVQEPPPTPEQTLATAQVEIEQSKQSLEALKTVLQDDRERDKLEADVVLRSAEISAKYRTEVDVKGIEAAINRDRDLLGHRAKLEQQAAAASAKMQEPVAQAPSTTINLPRPRKVLKTPIRGPDGRILSIHEEEVP
jgi:hypothetical protein